MDDESGNHYLWWLCLFGITMAGPLHPKTRFPDVAGEGWGTCHLCGGNPWYMVEVNFDSGSTEPTVGETLTGAESEHSGIVVSYYKTTGEWGTGDAAGTVELSDCSNTMDGLAFNDNEILNGSVGGSNLLTADGRGLEKGYGILYPRSHLVFEDGHYFCKPHYNWRFDRKHREETKIITGGDE